MSKNVNQLTDAMNLQDTDKLYLGRSPFGAADDFAITGAEIKTAAAAAAPVQSVNGLTGAVTGLIDTAGTGLTKTGTTLSITATGVSPGFYGSASTYSEIQVNAQGQIISVTNGPIAITASQVSNFNSATDARITNAVSTNVIQAYSANLQGLSNFGNLLPGPLFLTGVSGGITTYHTPIGTQTTTTVFNNLTAGANYGDSFDFTSASAKTVTLDFTGLSVGFYFIISNSGSGAMTFVAGGGSTISGFTSLPGGNGSTLVPMVICRVITIGLSLSWYIETYNSWDLLAGNNISISRTTSGTTIATSGPASLTWNDITGASATMSANNGYISDNGGLVSLTLPTTIAQGSVIEVAGNGAGGWKILQNASQVINFNSSSTTVGTGGSLASTDRYNAIKLLCTVANTTFTVISSEGNITIV